MEQQQQQQQNQHPNHEEMSNGNSGKISTSSYLCRQSSTRWTPTTEQIKLLKELYYINGVRSPNADQIQTICARLRRYGKIEGKNVFYWFQNHKARERQKKRLTPNSNSTTPAPPPQYQSINTNSNNVVVKNGSLHWKQEQDFSVQNNKYPNFNNHGVSCSSSSAGVLSGGGQLVGSFGYGAATMENKFRDCSISNVNQNYQWAAGNYNPYAPPSYTNFLDKFSSIDEDNDQDEDSSPEIETLPLFPMHNEDHHHDDHDHHGFYTIKPGSDGYYSSGYRWSTGNNGSASLELSLNSYGYGYYSTNI